MKNWEVDTDLPIMYWCARPYFFPFFVLEMDTFGPFFVEYTFTFPTRVKNPILVPPIFINHINYTITAGGNSCRAY